MEKQIFENLPYGEYERNVLDLYVPENAGKNNGIFFVIHGGGWNSCDKTVHKNDLIYWSDRGYISAAINYRYVSKDIHIPDILDDISLALHFVHGKLNEMGFDTDKAIFMGGSAGAHLCLVYAFTRRDSAPIKPVAIMDYCGPVDFNQPDFLIGNDGQYEDYKYGILSDCCGIKITKRNIKTDKIRKKLAELSPVTYADENRIPVIFGYGKIDDIVPFNQCEILRDILIKNGVENELVVYENSGHPLDRDKDASEKTKELCTIFAQKYLKT